MRHVNFFNQFTIGWITLFLFLVLCNGCKSQKETQSQIDKSNAAGIPVQVMWVEPSFITRQLTYEADIQGELEIKVFAQINERILSLAVEEGDVVKKRQTLAVLRSDNLSEGVRSAIAAVDATRADRDNLREELARDRALLEKNIISKAQVDQLRSRLLATEAQIRRLEAQTNQAATAQSYAVIRSPIAGVIGRRYLAQGDMATPNQPILTVVRMDKVDILLEVPEQDLALIRQDMTARIRVARYGNQAFVGKVTLISPTIDRQTRTARVKVKLENKQHQLMPGMLAQVSLEVERKDKVPVIPYGSLIIETDAQGKIAYRTFVVIQGKARERKVTVGIIDGERVEILGGIKFGEMLVTQGQHLIEEGRAVEVVEKISLAEHSAEDQASEKVVNDLTPLKRERR